MASSTQNRSVFKIIFDTNILWLNDEDKISRLFNSSLSESIKFLKENDLEQKVSLSIPEIVVQERREQTLIQIKEVVNKIDNGLNSLSGFGVKVSDKNYKKDYRKKVSKKLEDTLSGDNIELLKTPKFDQSSLIDRSLKKIKPFSGEGDKGFKDTLIWLTLLDDACKNQKINYILCTNNIDDFDKENLSVEFKEKAGGKFWIVKDLKELKQFLDKEFDLKLKLKELHKQIENEVKLKIGELMVEFNAQNGEGDENPSDRFFYNTYVPTMAVGYGLIDGDKDIVGYDFKEINIEDISELKNEVFRLRAGLIVRPRHKKKENGLSIYNTTLYYGEKKEQTYLITFNYNKLTGIINLLSSNKNYMHSVYRAIDGKYR